MIVNNQKRIKFVNDCGAIFDPEELEKAILWYQKKPTARTKHIYIHGKYPAVSIHDQKIHIHKQLAMCEDKKPLEDYIKRQPHKDRYFIEWQPGGKTP